MHIATIRNKRKLVEGTNNLRYNCMIISDLLFLRLFKRFFYIRVRGGFRVRARVGDSFRVRVRDRVT